MSKSIKLKNNIYWDTTSYSKILYDNQNGTQNNFTLSDNIKNYTYVEVIYGRSNWGEAPNSCRKGMCYGNGIMTIHLDYTYGYTSNIIDTSTTSLNFNGTNVAFDSARSIHLTTNINKTITCTNENLIKVFRVIGFK